MATQEKGGIFVCSANKDPSDGSIARKSNVIHSFNNLDEEEAAAAQ